MTALVLAVSFVAFSLFALPHHSFAQGAAKGGTRTGESLVDRINAMQLKEGNNLVHTSSEGTRLYAKVARGRLRGWAATDSSGNSTPVTLARSKDGSKESCKVCYKEGTWTTCYMVPCEILKLPKG